MGIVSGILDVSRRSLNAQSLVLRTIADNITNVNTPGYSRRTAELVTTQGSGIGNLQTGTGVEVNRVVRTVDEFLNREYRSRISDRAGEEIRQEYLARAEQPFALEDSPGHIGYELTNFFSSLADLQVSPADIPLRTQLIQSGQSLTSSVRDAFNHIANLQREADSRIGELVTQVNTFTSQIASINGQIVSGELANQENLTLRDSRDELLRKLSEILPVQTLETADGQIQVSLPNGFALVNGNQTQALDFTQAPDNATYPVGLDGSSLGHIVFDYNAATPMSQVDFTNLLAGNGGQIGALLRLRGVQASTDTSPFETNGQLVDIAARVETLARDLVIRFNQAYRGEPPFDVDETAGGTFQSTSVDLNGNAPSPFGLFNFFGASDVDADGLSDDLVASLAAANQTNVASTLAFAVQDERALALARDANPAGGVLAGAPGDSTIAQRLFEERSELIAYGSAPYGLRLIATSSIEDLYRQTASYVGGLGSKSASDLSALSDREQQVKELYASQSGVSLDEEFAKLINFQRAFEAAGRMVRVGDEMFQTILGLLG